MGLTWMTAVVFPCPPSFTLPSYPKDGLLHLEPTFPHRTSPLPIQNACQQHVCGLQHLHLLGVWEEGRSITKLRKGSTWQVFGIMSYSVWASPLLCSSVAVTLASKIQLTLVYCEALFNVCIHPPSDQTMTPNTLLFSLPHLIQAQSVTSQVSRPESLFKTIAFLFYLFLFLQCIFHTLL